MVQMKDHRKIQIQLNHDNKDTGKSQEWLSDAGHYPLLKAKKRLSGMIGMDPVLTFIREMYALVYVNECRRELGMTVTPQNYHMLFIGNPGTGKTTVARIMAAMLKDMEVLEEGHFIEADRADLVGEYIGQTAQKTKDIVKKAEGGILFIDEAYSLARGGEKDFGREAVDALVKAMEDRQHKFVLILAGYPDEMRQFLNLNPGLPSRFPNTLTFRDFSGGDMLTLTERLITEKQYQVTDRMRQKLYGHFQMLREADFRQNGRYVRNLVERIIRRQALRLLEEPEPMNQHTLMTLEETDMPGTGKE
ncbi:AAA family ATPase [Salibacterium halotolerans]|uniref:Stage V sporulation protein K n=1 Tax=Salibacterium halotolerans TaxID=1884432 RepID=A0A1I5UYJ6_9BACI|nr:AAA family ATPase [Salibacterium halotolerans]SFQ00117.1 stage V sporulation protein K [Salibacterium halotolerans]